MIIATATVRIRPDKIEDYENTFRALSALARAHEPGLLLYEIARDPALPHTYRIFEGYADEAAMQAHIDSDVTPPLRDALVACLAERPEIEVVHTVD